MPSSRGCTISSMIKSHAALDIRDFIPQLEEGAMRTISFGRVAARIPPTCTIAVGACGGMRLFFVGRKHEGIFTEQFQSNKGALLKRGCVSIKFRNSRIFPCHGKFSKIESASSDSFEFDVDFGNKRAAQNIQQVKGISAGWRRRGG